MKIIFLDIDGVVNTLRQAQRNYENETWSEDEFLFDHEAMMNLKDILEKTDACLVISSTWRIGRPDSPSWRVLTRNFNQYQIMHKIIGATPQCPDRMRCDEIQEWLDNTEEMIDSFVILDDITDMQQLQSQLVCTDMSIGITTENIQQTIEILNDKYT